MPRLIMIALGVLVMAGACGVAWADPAPMPDIATSNRSVEERIDYIEDKLDSRKLHAQVWFWSWMTINTTAAVALSAGAANTEDRVDRASYISQAVLAAAGVADLTLLRPLAARHGADELRALPDATPEERERKLGRAEAQLRANAERAASRKSWTLHLLNAAANIGSGLVVWAAGDGKAGATVALLGTLGGEAYIWTEPGGPVQDLADYERYRDGHEARVAGGWQFVPAPGGVAVRFRF